MATESHRWSRTDSSDALDLVDLASGRMARVGRPAESILPGALLADAESLTFRWANLVTQADAAREADLRHGNDPPRLLRALSWLLAFWAVTAETRFGGSAPDVIRSVDYRGPWRRDATAQDAHMWEALTQRVRIGALAALTADPQAVDAFHRATSEPPNVGPVLVRHTLIVLDGFSQDMLNNEINPRGLIATFVANTTPAAPSGPSSSFQPSRPPNPLVS
jgi:hypothetical protein